MGVLNVGRRRFAGGCGRCRTERGPLFHACRYLASNQIPIDTEQFGRAVYDDALDFYRAFVEALDRYPAPTDTDAVGAERGEWPIQRIHRGTTGIVALAQRTAALRADLACQ